MYGVGSGNQGCKIQREDQAHSDGRVGQKLSSAPTTKKEQVFNKMLKNLLTNTTFRLCITV